MVRSYSGSGTQVAATWDGRDSSGQSSLTAPTRWLSRPQARRRRSPRHSAGRRPYGTTDDQRVRGGVVSPNGDGIDDATKLSYVVSRPCQAEVGITDATGTLLRVVQAWTHVTAGAHRRVPGTAGCQVARA